MVDAEVIVVGAGHNGLICAAYLARAGIDTLLVEGRSEVGGCASTVTALDARFNICNCDHTMIRAMPVLDELDLHHHGLEYLEPDSGYIHLFHDRSTPWIHFLEPERTLDGLASTYPGAVMGYRRYLADAIPVAELVVEMARNPLHAPVMIRRAAANGIRAAIRLLRWSRQSMEAILRSYFDDWQMILPAASTGPTVWGVPPDLAGTGLAAALYATRHVVKTGRPKGGSGALTDAIASSFTAAGGTLRCGNRVHKLVVTDGAVRGVQLDDGTTLRSQQVVAAYDPTRVMIDWLDDIPAAARRAVNQYRTQPVHDGYESKIDGVLTAIPTYQQAAEIATAYPGVDLHSATTVVSPTPDQLREAHTLRTEHRVAPFPTLLVNTPSVLDTSMHTTPGEHILSLEALFTPYALPGGWPNSSEPERWIRLWSDLCEPGTVELDRWRAMTPDRYENEFAMHRGHTPSYAGSPLAALIGRPRSTTRYRSPIDGLYFTGAATFPGAGVFGASGRGAAEVLGRRDYKRNVLA